MSESIDVEHPLTLTIAMTSDRRSSGLEEVIGHACHTDEEIHAYVKATNGYMKAVPINFDFGTWRL